MPAWMGRVVLGWGWPDAPRPGQYLAPEAGSGPAALSRGCGAGPQLSDSRYEIRQWTSNGQPVAGRSPIALAGSNDSSVVGFRPTAAGWRRHRAAADLPAISRWHKLLRSGRHNPDHRLCRVDEVSGQLPVAGWVEALAFSPTCPSSAALNRPALPRCCWSTPAPGRWRRSRGSSSGRRPWAGPATARGGGLWPGPGEGTTQPEPPRVLVTDGRRWRPLGAGAGRRDKRSWCARTACPTPDDGDGLLAAGGGAVG